MKFAPCGRPAPETSLLESGALPVEDLAALARREGLRPRPIYQVHRWFARRFGTAFRALLTAAALSDGADFWRAYYEGVDWSGKTVLDPFVGGGTSVVEAQRLGASVIGVDVDAVACAITRFETRAADAPDLGPALQRLKREVGRQVAPYYRTTGQGGSEVDVLHFFWVQVVDCSGCGVAIEAHPHYQLAYDSEGTEQWAFCPRCHVPQRLPRTTTAITCAPCGVTVPIAKGPVQFGRLTCPCCGTPERLIDVTLRTNGPPAWRLFALEVLDPEAACSTRPVPLARRSFQAATDADRAVLTRAEDALRKRTAPNGQIAWIPDRAIPARGRSDDRLTRYGYTRYRELFNPRQLLHLSLLAEAIAALEGPERQALALAFSDHLTTNCMMAAYAFGWRRVTPLFSVRAFRHIPRPVEINPWLDGTGRGTFPNAVRQIQRAAAFARAPQEPQLGGGFRHVQESWAGRGERARVLHRSAAALAEIASASVDLVLTDPPYFDNIAYSELSDFYLPWLQQFGLAPADGHGPSALRESLAAKTRDDAAVATFRAGLRRCFGEIARVLKPEGRLVFTFQHRTAGAWEALAAALAGAGLRPIQVFPLLGDARGGLHAHEGSSRWDAVFVAVRGDDAGADSLRVSDTAVAAADRHAAAWTTRLATLGREVFREADACTFRRACLVAAALGMFPVRATTADRPLAEALAATELPQPARTVH